MRLHLYFNDLIILFNLYNFLNVANLLNYSLQLSSSHTLRVNFHYETDIGISPY